MPGPIPKRSEDRRRRNKTNEAGLQVVQLPGSAAAAPPPDKAWHPLARDWYNSLRHSGQARLFQASDWAQAQVVAELLSDEMDRPGKRAQMMDTIFRAMDSLLTSEGARRRLAIEFENTKAEHDEAQSEIMQIYQEKLSG